MKRSEMLSKIASVIINYNEVDSVIKREKALEMAETILQVQEEAGMLPPFVDLDKPIGNKDYFTLHIDQSVYSGLCEWEPE